MSKNLIEKAASRLREPHASNGFPPPGAARVPDAPGPDAPIPLAVPVHRPQPAAGDDAPGQSIDRARLRRLGVMTPDDERTQIGEQFRLLKRPILDNAFGPPASRLPRGNLVMVASSLPGEGKSFCAVNLAISIAMEMDRTVLLVDADVERSKVLHYLGLTARHGLLDILRTPELTVGDALVRTDIERLTVLPGGTPYKRATELLASEAMRKLVRELASRYPDRLILFDSPPLLMTTEATVLAAHMGQIIVVVEERQTPQDALKKALAMIAGLPVSGLVLNKSTARHRDYYYDAV
ncbi:MAG: XrtA-associated tyrosine autokinase [Betaproteobacteria bacterium]|nr:XrtA-associated tyrosine autokinase [Betaproteobacteria bacterium]